MNSYESVLVSVIIPFFNVEQYLKRCVDSVCAQTHHNLEIILVNDSSTDSCPEICSKFAEQDSRIVVLHQKEGVRGAGLARNMGIDVARGEWLCFVDSDDFISPHFVEELLKTVLDNDCMIAQCANKATYCNVENVMQPATEIKIMNWRDYLFFVAYSENHSLFSACTNIYHRSLFESIRFSAYMSAEDAEMVSRLMLASREKLCAVTNQILYYCYQRPQSLSRGKRNVGWLDVVSAWNSMVETWKKTDEQELIDIYWAQYFSYLIYAATEGQRDIVGYPEKFSFILEQIKLNLEMAKKSCHPDLTIPASAREAWNDFLSLKTRFVMYGYGDIGRRHALPWARYFNLPVVEIWDQRAAKGETIDGIPFCPAHGGLDKNITILITIGEKIPYLPFMIQARLREMGYRNFVRWPVLEAALKYARYERFLPFLIEGNLN